jgi:precorrin-2 methylase
MVNYVCPKCNKEFKKKDHFITHTTKKKFPCKINLQIPEPIIIIPIQNISKTTCLYCKKIFSTGFNLNKHVKNSCKVKKNLDDEKKNIFNLLLEKNEIIKKKNNELDNIKKETDEFKKLIKKISNIEPINKQLLNIISDKDKKIEELVNNTDIIVHNKINNSNNNIIKIIENKSLVLNNTVISSRKEDNYINATQLCIAGNKIFNDWYQLDSTNEIINELTNNIFNLELIQINENSDTWIYPDLAVELAQWLSYKFTFPVSRWIKNLFIEDNVQLKNSYKNELVLKDKKIKILEDVYLKKHKRISFNDKNVIYLLTTEYNKSKRIYIVGKSKKLETRLSTYNKTAEHEVVYYKSCRNEEQMDFIETLVIKKLESYKEKANRDRFILPIDKDISFFTNIIDKSINFFED